MKILHILAAVSLGLSAPSHAGPIRLGTPWIRETPPSSKVGAAYALLINKGRTEDRLLGGSTSVADHIEVHSMVIDQGVMRMRPVESGLAVPAGGSVMLQPGSFHIMLMGLKRTLRRGESIPMTLRFAKAGNVTVNFRVQAIDYQPSGGQK